PWLLRRHWYGGLDRGTGSGIADERKASAKPRRTLAHREEAKGLARRRRRITFCRNEPAAVVRDRELHAVLLEVQDDVDLRRAAVFDGVGNRLLRNPQELHVGIAGARARAARDRELGANASGFRRVLGQLAQHVPEGTRLHRVVAHLEARFTGFPKAMSGLFSTPAQPISSRILGRLELRGDRFQLDTNRREALKQRVVNLA